MQSEAFHALLAHVHLVELPHKGVEATLQRIRESFHPVGNARQAIALFKSACPKCRLILKRVVRLELAQFPSWRTTVAPRFYAIQMDIAMNFRVLWRMESVGPKLCHALVIVCLLTSATNILAMQGLTSESVVLALERHAARYGMPAHIFVDSGTQLAKLESSWFHTRGPSSVVSEKSKFNIKIATPKAHQHQGQVESKIKVMMSTLRAWQKVTDSPNSILGWETVFARVASAIDDVPIARGSASAASDLGWEIITPNRLKLGRNNYRQLEGPVILEGGLSQQLRRNRLITAKWYELFIERISLLVPPPKVEHDRQPELGDVVLFVHQDPNYKKLWTWKLGLIVEKVSRTTYKIRYSVGGDITRFLEQAVGQISIIVPVDQVHVQHPDFFSH